MFTDNIMICSESWERVEEYLESWRYAVERRGIKVSQSKTEYAMNESETGVMLKMYGGEVKTEEFKYLESVVESNAQEK